MALNCFAEIKQVILKEKLYRSFARQELFAKLFIFPYSGVADILFNLNIKVIKGFLNSFPLGG